MHTYTHKHIYIYVYIHVYMYVYIYIGICGIRGAFVMQRTLNRDAFVDDTE